MIHMRHEQSCAYAADAYARTTGRPGVLSVTAGCGLTNAVTGLCVAGLTGSPVVCIAGQHPDHRGPARLVPGGVRRRDLPHLLQVHEARARLVDDRVDLRLAFREAMGPPPGPTLVEIPTNILYQQDDVARQRPGRARLPARRAPQRGRSRRRSSARSRRSPRAERPLIVAGDGVFWSDAAAELRAFAAPHADPRLHAPRRPGRACPRTTRSPSAAPGRSRSPGAPTWSSPSASSSGAASTSASRRRGAPTRRTSRSTRCRRASAGTCRADVPMVGDPKLVLAPAPRRAHGRSASTARDARGGPWLAEVAERPRPASTRALREQEADVHDAMPIHPARLTRELLERDGPRRHARRRQLHALGLALAVVRRALPGPDRRRRPARARRPRHRHGHRRRSSRGRASR